MTPELQKRFEEAVKGLEGGLDDLKTIIAEMEGAVKPEKKRGRKTADEPPADLSKVVIEHPCGCKTGKDVASSIYCAEHKKNIEASGLASGTTGSKAIKVEDVTIEMLRAMATKYSEVFGMEKLLSLNTKHGGAKKLSGIDPKMYGVVYGAMTDDLAAAEAIKANAEKPPTNGELAKKAEALAKEIGPITIEKMREHAATFLAKNGEPAFRAVLKAFGAEKLSGVPEDKRGAFLEAINNA